MIINPFRYATSPAWTPASLTVPPSLWLDDQSAVTDVSGLASQWNDRSSNGWHATQGTSGNRPTIVASALNGHRVLRADGNDALSLPIGSRSLFRNVTSGWIFCVANKTGSDVGATSRRVIVWTNNSTSARFGLYWDDATSGAQNRLVIGARRLDAGAYNRLESTTTSVGAWVMALAAVDWSARTINLYINGSLDGTVTGAFDASGATSNSTSADVSLYASPSISAPWVGDNAAALAGVTIPGSGDIDRLFGYYAHRYGLTGNLPGGHPYKTTPP